MSPTIRAKLGISLTAALAIAGCQDAERITQPHFGPTASLGTASVASTPFAYVANAGSNTVSVIATATNTVVATVAVGPVPDAVAITPDGAFAYVANHSTVSVIATASNTVVATVGVGSGF